MNLQLELEEAQALRTQAYLVGAGDSQAGQQPHPHLATGIPQEQALGVPGKQQGAQVPLRAGSTAQHRVEAASQELMGTKHASAERLHISLSVFQVISGK